VTPELRIDFLNLQACAKQISKALGVNAHSFVDNFGNVISILSPEIAAPGTVDVVLRGKVVGQLSAEEASRPVLKGMLEGLLESELKAFDSQCVREGDQLLAHDLESLLDLSEQEDRSLEELLTQSLRLLRAHLWLEKATVYGMLDGFTLESLVGLGWQGDAWRTAYLPAAGAAASSRKPHLIADAANDPQLKEKAAADGLRDLLCHPITHGSQLLGVLVLGNRVGGAFSEDDMVPLKRFMNVISHLLQKHLLTTRMQEFERTTGHLGKYLSKKIVKDVKGKSELQLGGVEKKVVCLFSDIRGYTSITEDISAATLVNLLNFHFERMHAIIEKNEGTLDKIVGDLIMAVWNIPKDQPEPELLAMKAALEMQKEMIRAVIPEWQRHGVEKVGMGVGVNSGLALAGNLGSSRFMNYTVIGDAINTAQRLEAKAQAGEIWMAESIYPLVHGKLEKPVRRELDIRLKGKDKTINAFVYKPLQY
jgi:class 3 adenylate cyclase